MADIVYSDLNEIALSITKKILSESDLTADDLAFITGQGILNFINTFGYVKEADFVDNLSVIIKNNAGNLENILIQSLETAFPVNYKRGFDFTVGSSSINVGGGQFYLRNIFAGLNKTWAAFAVGDGNGCLNGSSLNPVKQYYIYLIKNISFGTFDIFVDVDDTNMPLGWTKKFTLGAFYTDLSSVPINGSDTQPNEYDTYGANGLPFEKDYISDVTLSYVNPNTIQISACMTRDSSNLYNQKHYTIKNEVFLLSADITYYLFQVSNKGTDVSYEIDTNKDGSGLSANTFRLIGKFSTNSSSQINKGSIISIIDDKNDFVVVAYSRSLTGVADSRFMLAGEKYTEASGQTGNYTTDFAATGSKIEILVNSISVGGIITITGIKKDKTTGIPSNATEDIIIDTTANQSYLTFNNWDVITDISLGIGISGINYDIIVSGFQTGLETNFVLVGYSLEFMTQSDSSDINIKIETFKRGSGNKIEYKIIEDIGFDSNSATNQIIDNLRTGADDRSLNSTLARLFPNNRNMVFDMADFNNYFNAGENVMLNGEGFRIELSGAPSGTITNIDWLQIHIFTLVLKQI